MLQKEKAEEYNKQKQVERFAKKQKRMQKELERQKAAKEKSLLDTVSSSSESEGEAGSPRNLELSKPAPDLDDPKQKEAEL